MSDASDEKPTDSTEGSGTREHSASTDSPVPPPVNESPKPITTAAVTVTNSSPKPKVIKVDILLKPAGDAPIMKQKKWTVERTKRIGEIAIFIQKYIKIDTAHSVFLYVNQAFAPSPDATVGTLFDCFGSDGKLVLHYSKMQAWG